MFENREEAGVALANSLKKYEKKKDVVILGIPRGGVIPAYEVAQKLELPMDVIFVKKLGHPSNEEFAIGAVSADDFTVNSSENISRQYIHSEVQRIQEKIRAQQKRIRAIRKPIPLRDKVVILVDDGIATGLTIYRVIELVRKAGAKKLVVAIPVAPFDSLQTLRSVADEVVCLETPAFFNAVSAHYVDFEQVSDEQVEALLRKSVQ